MNNTFIHTSSSIASCCLLNSSASDTAGGGYAFMDTDVLQGSSVVIVSPKIY